MEIRKPRIKLGEKCIINQDPQFRKKSEFVGYICDVSLLLTNHGPLTHFCRYQGQTYIPENAGYGFFTCEYRCSQKK